MLFSRFGHIQRLNFYGVIAMILFNECIIYYLQRFNWETVRCETDECNRVLFVADPQILGEEKETRFLARYDSDRHISRNYKQAFSHVQPDVVVFLGDLIGELVSTDFDCNVDNSFYSSDESSFADDFKYQRYFLRFMEIFPHVENVQTIYLPGNFSPLF